MRVCSLFVRYLLNYGIVRAVVVVVVKATLYNTEQ